VVRVASAAQMLGTAQHPTHALVPKAGLDMTARHQFARYAFLLLACADSRLFSSSSFLDIFAHHATLLSL
jgi:hypothetical protein